MKIALVHELLTIKGGAERMLRVLAAMYPDAPIYTLLYDEEKLGDWFPRERVITSNIQRWASHIPNSQFLILNSQFRYNHHLYLPFFPRAVEAWDFSEFDLVISSSSAFVHGIITNGKPKHLCYVHSPARYLWDRTHDVLEHASHGILGPIRRAYLGHVFHKLRVWDAESADRPDKLLAASKTVQRRIELYWRRESTVLCPPIDDNWLSPIPNTQSLDPRSYFLVVSQLAPYKRIDLAIEACNHLRLPLKIIGSGPDRKRLEKLAGPTVTFLGYIPEERLPELYQGALATIFPGEEDFGLVPLESMACGTPVIAFRGGGALETVQEKVTGEFFGEPTAASLAQTLQDFDRNRFQEEACHTNARKFSRDTFEQGIRKAVESLFHNLIIL